MKGKEGLEPCLLWNWNRPLLALSFVAICI